MVRKLISKGTRFNTFRRDGFTCQYCGRRPPEVVLEIDHILPVSQGGDNDQMNLVTACFECNRGKAAKLLDRPQAPDADLEWLELQQEVAELERYQIARAKRERALETTAHCLQDSWLRIYDPWMPAEHIIRRMLVRYSPDMIEDAFRDVAVKVAGGYLNKKNWVPYTWGVLRNLAKDESDA